MWTEVIGLVDHTFAPLASVIYLIPLGSGFLSMTLGGCSLLSPTGVGGGEQCYSQEGNSMVDADTYESPASPNPVLLKEVHVLVSVTAVYTAIVSHGHHIVDVSISSISSIFIYVAQGPEFNKPCQSVVLVDPFNSDFPVNHPRNIDTYWHRGTRFHLDSEMLKSAACVES